MATAYTIDPGELNEKIILSRRTVTKDAYGQDTITWTELGQPWARVRALSGREFFAAAQTQQEQTLEIIVRYRTDLDATCRLTWQGRQHDITVALPIGREWTKIMALQGVKDGR